MNEVHATYPFGERNPEITFHDFVKGVRKSSTVRFKDYMFPPPDKVSAVESSLSLQMCQQVSQRVVRDITTSIRFSISSREATVVSKVVCL